MSNEDPNKNFLWRSKLDQVEHLPGESFNKDVAWNTLHDRLQKKKQAGRVLLYWIAAACVLFVALITVVLQSLQPMHHETVIKNTAEKKAPPMRVDESHHFENKYNGSIVTYHRPVRDLRSRGNRRVLAVRNTFAISSKNIADTNTAVRPVAVILKIVETPSSISAFVTKKTLNTVHINELGDPADEAPFMVHKNDRHNKLKLGSEEVLAGSSRSSKTLALGF